MPTHTNTAQKYSVLHVEGVKALAHVGKENALYIYKWPHNSTREVMHLLQLVLDEIGPQKKQPIRFVCQPPAGLIANCYMSPIHQYCQLFPYDKTDSLLLADAEYVRDVLPHIEVFHGNALEDYFNRDMLPIVYNPRPRTALLLKSYTSWKQYRDNVRGDEWFVYIGPTISQGQNNNPPLLIGEG